MDDAVEIRDLVVHRGGRRVLDRVTATFPRASITGILGPSGSGKTTLLRAVLGVQAVTSGQVTVLGSPAGSPELRPRIGYLTQTPSLYTDLTVQENVRYFAGLYGIRGSRADAVLHRVGLGGQVRQLVRELSGGQRSRASLACCLVADPDLLVLDEPTVGQDPVLRDELWARFRDLASGGTTLLVSSHVMEEANRCERLLLIREGGIIAHGATAAVKTEAGTDDLDEAFLRLVRRRGPA